LAHWLAHQILTDFDYSRESLNQPAATAPAGAALD
jgi:hypothetical protein